MRVHTSRARTLETCGGCKRRRRSTSASEASAERSGPGRSCRASKLCSVSSRGAGNSPACQRACGAIAGAAVGDSASHRCGGRMARGDGRCVGCSVRKPGSGRATLATSVSVPGERRGQHRRRPAHQGRMERAERRLASVLPAIGGATGWAPNYVRIVCDAAATLWLIERKDHVEIIERNLREKVIAPDFRYPMVDSRLAMARLCALQQRYNEAVDWFAKARTVLDQQGARPLRAIVDFDEALMYARRGEPGDAERARPLLDAALARFRSLGMPGWIRRA